VPVWEFCCLVAGLENMSVSLGWFLGGAPKVSLDCLLCFAALEDALLIFS